MEISLNFPSIKLLFGIKVNYNYWLTAWTNFTLSLLSFPVSWLTDTFVNNGFLSRIRFVLVNDARAFSQCSVYSFIILVFFLVVIKFFFSFFSSLLLHLLYWLVVACWRLGSLRLATSCYSLLSYSYLFQPVTTFICPGLLRLANRLSWLILAFHGLLNPSNVLRCLGLFWLATICQIFAWLATDCRVFLACRGLQRRTTRERAKLTDINFKTNIC